jgi:kynureninase
VLGAYAALEGARLTAEAGVPALAAKGAALTSYAIELADRLGLAVASPRDPARRGSHVSLHHPAAWQLCQAWKAAGVIPDYRAPERVRIGLAPLYTRFVDVYDAMARLEVIVTTGSYEQYPKEPGRVT